MIVMKSSENWQWPWSDAGEKAESVFASSLPSLYSHMSSYRDELTARQDQGRFWWELRSCAYWPEFEKPKIMYPEITWRAEWSFDERATFSNNTVYVLPTDDLWILAVANSPVNWWYSWRNAIHGKDEALRFIKDYAKTIPIPTPNAKQRSIAENLVRQLVATSKTQQSTRKTLLDWFAIEYDIEKPSMKLQDPISLDSDSLVNEIKKLRGKKHPLSAAALKALRDEDARTLEPARRLQAEALTLENQLSDLVNAAYGLTPEEVKLMWDTAPPRMPIPRPAGV